MELTVKTTEGLVRGEATRHGAFAFRGIPFAAAPVGPLRFKPPARPASWDGTRDATRFGDVVPQAKSPGAFGDLFDPTNPQGPDCLNLNVWTPDLGAVGLPVLVWIHGGAFTIGSGSDSLYDGASFARDGIVTVTINYRLGVAGFHHTGDEPGSGAFGVLDMIAALEWVQENIASFGGDPNRVTIAGESAGGMSVGTLLGAPAAKGLFRRAIPQSGAGHHAMSPAGAALIAARLTDALGGADPASATDAQLIAAQREVSQQILLSRDPERFGVEATTSSMGWLPMAGGDVLPQRAIDAIAAGSAKDVDVLVGTCRDEFMLFLGVDPAALGFDESMASMLYGMTFGAKGDDAFALYQSNRPGAPAVELLGALQTDQMFRIPGIRLAEAQVANGARTFSYLFSWESPMFGGRIKAGHALELPFTWDNLDDRMAVGLVGEDAPQGLADEMHGAWVRFITDGDPGWAPYDLASRTTRQFGGDADLLEDPYGDERVLWDGLL